MDIWNEILSKCLSKKLPKISNLSFKKYVNVMFFFILIFLLQFIVADVVSVNPGGSTEIAVTSDKYIEGFFFGLTEPVEDTEEPPETPEEPSSGPGTSPDPSPLPYNIVVRPTEFNINLEVNKLTEKVIRVTNLEESQITIPVRELELTNIVTFGSTFLTIPAGQTVELNVKFIAPSEPGIYSGKIMIGNKEILVTINARSEFLLFDSDITVINENSVVQRGESLLTVITLIPFGEVERMDVTLEFEITDFRRGVYYEDSETLLVSEQIQLERSFETKNLEPGEYIIGFNLIYPTGAENPGVAPASAHFFVVKRPLFWRIVLFLMISILVLLIVIIIILIMKRLEEREEEKRQKSGDETLPSTPTKTSTQKKST